MSATTSGWNGGRSASRRATNGPPTSGAASRSTTINGAPGGGLRTGALLTSIDSLGGFLSGLAVQPKWIVTTNMMVTRRPAGPCGAAPAARAGPAPGPQQVVAALDIFDEGDDDRPVAAALMTCAVLDPGDMQLQFDRPFVCPMPPLVPDAPGPVEFFGIEPGTGPVTRLDLTDASATRGASSTAAGWPCWPTWPRAGRWKPGPTRVTPARVAAGDTVLHYLSPARVGPVEARCQVLGGRPGRTLVRVAIHDVGAGDRMVAVGSVAVLDVSHSDAGRARPGPSRRR